MSSAARHAAPFAAPLAEPLSIAIETCRLDDDADVSLKDARAALSSEERARAARFVFDRDRIRFIRARGFLRRALADRLSCAPGAVRIAPGRGGKPVVLGAPLRFNLSHSDDYAVLALSDAHELGVDVEILGAGGSAGLGAQLDGLSRACLAAPEQRALARTAVDDRARRFLSFWTAKEALMKLTGDGLALDPRAVALRLDASGAPVGYEPSHGAPAPELFPLALPRRDAVCHLAAAPVANLSTDTPIRRLA